MIKEIFEHRSIRKYKQDAIPAYILQKILEAGIRASNTGNMQMYSIIVTSDPDIKKQLAPCHFNQPMVTQAPVIMTFCVDIGRFSKWCRLNDAEPAYDNFLWFMNGTIDGVLASQNIALAAQSEGLGICYLGTTTYTATKISEILELPEGVIPVTAMVMGYPESVPPLTDRLPLEAVVHYERYHDYTDSEIRELWAEREASEETSRLLKENGLPNLAQIFTRNRYKKEDNLLFSREYFEALKKQGFFNQ